MKTRLTIPIIAFALALAGMSVRTHIRAAAVDRGLAAANVTDCQVLPASRAFAQRATHHTSRSSLGNPGALKLEGAASAHSTRPPNPQSWLPPCR
jgi:hypothetical protein